MPQGCTTLAGMTSDTSGLPALPCPQCRQEVFASGRTPQGGNRIGNRRTTCNTCNAFAQNVTRIASKRLREAYAKEYAQIRVLVERDLYPQVIEDFVEKAARR